MEPDQKKILLAVTLLVLALSALGFQVFRRIDRDARGETAPADTGVMLEAAPASMVGTAVAWVAPADYGAALESNPFLRPASASRRSPSSRDSKRHVRPHEPSANFTVTGIRTGPIPSVIVNDRTRRVGDEIAGWRIVSIERDRVTLRSSHGRTIRLDAR